MAGYVAMGPNPLVIISPAAYNCKMRQNCSTLTPTVGRDSSVGIAPRYRLDGPGTESRWRRDFQHPSRPPLLYNWYRVFLET